MLVLEFHVTLILTLLMLFLFGVEFLDLGLVQFGRTFSLVWGLILQILKYFCFSLFCFSFYFGAKVVFDSYMSNKSNFMQVKIKNAFFFLSLNLFFSPQTSVLLIVI